MGLLGVIHPRISFGSHHVLNVSYLSIRLSIFTSFGSLSLFSSQIFGSFTKLTMQVAEVLIFTLPCMKIWYKSMRGTTQRVADFDFNN